jgi:putative alpha-1,2-mannosidase
MVLFDLALRSALALRPLPLPVGFLSCSVGVVVLGGTMPFVVAPFCMTDWTARTPQNKVGGTSFYKYQDNVITHQPAIWMGDYGYVTLMPEVGIQSSKLNRGPLNARPCWIMRTSCVAARWSS